MRSLAILLVSAVGVFGSYACSAQEGVETDEANATARSPRKASEFVRCWAVSDGTADAFFRRFDVKCRVTSSGLVGLEGSRVYVDARTQNGRVVSKELASRDTDVVVGTVASDAFPLSVSVYGTWAKAPVEGSTFGESVSYFQTSVPLLEAATVDAPVVVKMPFDTWSVTIRNQRSFGIVGTARYEVSAAPFRTEQDMNSTKQVFSTSAQTAPMRGPSEATLELPAPKDGQVTLKASGSGNSVDLIIRGPGTFVLDDAGLRAVADAPMPASDGGAGDGSASSDGGQDAGPAACGTPDQAPCTNPYGNKVCNPGTRLVGNLCRACGADAQTYCFNQNGSKVCNAGTRLVGETCTACGKAGQTYCFNQNGFKVCDADLRLHNDTCKECGAAGEIACLNNNGFPVCDGSLRPDSSGICR